MIENKWEEVVENEMFFLKVFFRKYEKIKCFMFGFGWMGIKVY